jgi:hypothetical protein
MLALRSSRLPRRRGFWHRLSHNVMAEDRSVQRARQPRLGWFVASGIAPILRVLLLKFLLHCGNNDLHFSGARALNRKG